MKTINIVDSYRTIKIYNNNFVSIHIAISHTNKIDTNSARLWHFFTIYLK